MTHSPTLLPSTPPRRLPLLQLLRHLLPNLLLQPKHRPPLKQVLLVLEERRRRQALRRRRRASKLLLQRLRSKRPL